MTIGEGILIAMCSAIVIYNVTGWLLNHFLPTSIVLFSPTAPFYVCNGCGKAVMNEATEWHASLPYHPSCIPSTPLNEATP